MRKIAIATPQISTPSETFIREHIRTIAPGRTVVLTHEVQSAGQVAAIASARMQSWVPPRSPHERVLNGVYGRWRTYVSPDLAFFDRNRVRAFLREHDVDCVLAEYGSTGCMLARTCAEADVPLYVHFHGYDASSELKHAKIRRRYRQMFRYAAGVIAPSQFLADKLAAIGCPRTLLSLSPYGIATDGFRPASPARDPRIVLAVGRLVDKKAPDLTIRAFGLVAQEVPDLVLELIGDGPRDSECRRLVSEHGLSDRVIFHGFKDAAFVRQRMSVASVFVQHSVTAPNGDTEGLPVAILEAMSSALPVVSTRHSGIPELVVEGSTGFLVEEKDVTGMAEALGRVVSDSALAARLGAAGRDRILAGYTTAHTADRLRRIMGLPEEHGLRIVHSAEARPIQ